MGIVPLAPLNDQHPPRVRSRVRAVLINAALASGAVALAILLAEGAVRLVAPQQLILIRPDFWVPADTIGWTHRANADVTMNTGERTVRIVTDHDGFRVGSAGRTEADTRVLVLGDSFMEALQVEYEQSFPGLLQALLPERLRRPVAVRNASVGGWDPNQYLLRGRQILAEESYHLILVMVYVGNDVIRSRTDYFPPRRAVERKRFRFPRRLAWRELVDAVAAPINDFFEVRSHLYIFGKTRLETLRMRLGLTDTYLPPDFLKSAQATERWALTADACRDLAELARRAGAETIFVLVPAPFQVNAQTFGQYLRGFGIDSSTVDLDQPNRLLTEALQQRQLEMLDALPALRQLQSPGGSGGGPRLYGTVDAHLTAEGHAALANVALPAAVAALTRGVTPAHQPAAGRRSGPGR
jgi:hypothetical protein